MLAAGCVCAEPCVFANAPETCHRCGHAIPVRVTASTKRLAVATAEVMLGYRRLGERRGQYDRGVPE